MTFPSETHANGERCTRDWCRGGDPLVLEDGTTMRGGPATGHRFPEPCAVADCEGFVHAAYGDDDPANSAVYRLWCDACGAESEE